MPERKFIKHKNHGYPTSDGTPTWPRSSFENTDIHREDRTAGSGMVQRRYIDYLPPSPQLARVRDSLASEGLVLGEELPPPDTHTVRFVIPLTARPLVHDTAVRANGPSVYDDGQLFFDLGRILKRVATVDPNGFELASPVGDHIAFVNYTKIGDPKLALVPGFEHDLRPVGDTDEGAMNRYAVAISAQFGERFIPHIGAFVEGYAD